MHSTHTKTAATDVPKIMAEKILIILAHPARDRVSFCESLALSYLEGAKESGYDAEILKISDLAFDPILHEGYKEPQHKELDIVSAQEKMFEADHWVIVYPLWQFMIPALLKGFLERTLIKGFAYDFRKGTPLPTKPLKGKTARIIQTMGMPNFAWSLFFHAHGEKALRSMLNFIGIRPIRITRCGLAESTDQERRSRYLAQIKWLGNQGC